MTLRHVPDDELHAYLDQALSRSQCVEIETHMADCARCSDRRDADAALRDRTTALLAQVTPRKLIIPPPYQSLVERESRLVQFTRLQRSARRAAIWAAGVVAAVGAGWAGRSIIDPPVPLSPVLASADPEFFKNAVPLGATAFTQSGPHVTDAPAMTPIPIPNPPREVVTARRVSVTRPVEPDFAPAPALQLIFAGLPAHEGITAEPAPLSQAETSHSPFDRIWRSVTWEEALQIAGSSLPFVEGMPVVGVLVQPGNAGERPTVIVAQQDGTGEVIQSIEGPVGKVTEMLQRQYTPDVHASALSRTPPDYVDERGGSVRRAIRVLTVTGRLPVDSLNALAKVATIR